MRGTKQQHTEACLAEVGKFSFRAQKHVCISGETAENVECRQREKREAALCRQTGEPAWTKRENKKQEIKQGWPEVLI
jgi:hypothetical protein